MKATLSQDGNLRFDMRIAHRVGLDEIVQMVAAEYAGKLESLPARMSQAAIMAIVRSRLEQYGIEGATTSAELDFMGYETHRQFEERILPLVRPAFPELAPRETP